MIQKVQGQCRDVETAEWGDSRSWTRHSRGLYPIESGIRTADEIGAIGNLLRLQILSPEIGEEIVIYNWSISGVLDGELRSLYSLNVNMSWSRANMGVVTSIRRAGTLMVRVKSENGRLLNILWKEKIKDTRSLWSKDQRPDIILKTQVACSQRASPSLQMRQLASPFNTISQSHIQFQKCAGVLLVTDGRVEIWLSGLHAPCNQDSRVVLSPLPVHIPDRALT